MRKYLGTILESSSRTDRLSLFYDTGERTVYAVDKNANVEVIDACRDVSEAVARRNLVILYGASAWNLQFAGE